VVWKIEAGSGQDVVEGFINSMGVANVTDGSDGTGSFTWHILIYMLQILFVINNPEVYKSPTSNTYM
jgi:hypothetical protein